jgi:POT family proton-dependent oligopeptide transporter
VLGAKALGTAGLEPGAPADAATRQRAWMMIGGVFGLLALIGVLGVTGVIALSPTFVADTAGYLLLATVVIFFAWLFLSSTWTPEERKRLWAIFAFFLAAALFWSAFEQAGSTLNLFADRNTDSSLFGYAFPSSWFQSANALFIIAFAPVFAWLWIRLGDREPSSPVKFSLGLIGVGGGFAVLIIAAQRAEAGVMVSPWWLLACYLLHTLGELCLSPVGLSSMTKLAPARILSLMMGVWFLATSVGNYIGGRLAGFYESWPLPSLFTAVAAFGIGAGVIMLLLSPVLKRMTGEARN